MVGAYYRPLFYDPFFYDPWFPYRYGWYPPYAYGQFYDRSASLRLQVSPRETEVFIAGYYAGTVDNFDGFFQRLHLEPGEHDVTLYLAGYRTVTQKILLAARRHVPDPPHDGSAARGHATRAATRGARRPSAGRGPPRLDPHRPGKRRAVPKARSGRSPSACNPRTPRC